MAFKMNGWSAFTKTSSPNKRVSHEQAKKNNPELDNLIKQARNVDKDSDEYDMIQDKINAAYESSKVHTKNEPINIEKKEISSITTDEPKSNITTLPPRTNTGEGKGNEKPEKKPRYKRRIENITRRGEEKEQRQKEREERKKKREEERTRKKNINKTKREQKRKIDEQTKWLKDNPNIPMP
tara:strand:- start:1957 stop:2502 length:546 start_codon:yes stop_codon:yes gene_type:complete